MFFLYFEKGKIVVLRLKTFLCFLKKAFSTFRKTVLLQKISCFRRELSTLKKIKKFTLKKCLIFQEMEPSSQKLKNLKVFSKKFFYISGGK